MISVNDLLMDEAIRHQITLAKYSNGLVQRMMAVLNRSDARLFNELQSAIDRFTPSTFTVERLESVLGSVLAMNAQAYAQVGSSLRIELQDFVKYEASYQHQALETALPVNVHAAAISAEQVYAAALARPFQGVLLKGALQDLEFQKAQKIRQIIAQGFVEGKTSSQMVRELRGSRAAKYADGLMEGNRKNVEAVVRTAVGHLAGFTQDRTAEANVDLIKAVEWISKLDLKTSPTCQVRDNKLYHPVSHKPLGHVLPWLSGPGRAHWRCRSAQAYVLKSYKELGIPGPEVKMKNGTRASMDGQVALDLSYFDWLKKQNASRQDQVLGTTRGQLLRQGKLPLDRMYNLKGQQLTLDQIREHDAAAFKRAGL